MISQNFPRRVLEICRLYKYDEELRNDLNEFQRLHQELRIEAALIMVVSPKLILSACRSLMRYVQNSPYAEVRAVVDNHDDPNLPTSTFRSWVIGTIFVAAAGFINQFLSIRYPGIYVGPNVVQLLCVPPSLIPHKQQLTVDRG